MEAGGQRGADSGAVRYWEFEPARRQGRTVARKVRILLAEGVSHNLVIVSIKKSYPMQACKITHGLSIFPLTLDMSPRCSLLQDEK